MSSRPHLVELGDELSGELTAAYDDDEVSAYAVAVEQTPPAWWETAYAGGPPAGPAELVRPLYFPGNPAGRPPSEPGPDVVAVNPVSWVIRTSSVVIR